MSLLAFLGIPSIDYSIKEHFYSLLRCLPCDKTFNGEWSLKSHLEKMYPHFCETLATDEELSDSQHQSIDPKQIENQKSVNDACVECGLVTGSPHQKTTATHRHFK